MDEQVLQDLIEFLRMVDFDRNRDGTIVIVENQFKFEEFPAFVQNYLKRYFAHIDSIS